MPIVAMWLLTCTQAMPGDQATASALNVLTQLAQHRWDSVAGQFDPTMRRDLPASTLASAWYALESSNGPYGGHGSSRVTEHGELTTVDVDTHFGGKLIDYRITFDPSGQIAGLYLLNT